MTSSAISVRVCVCVCVCVCVSVGERERCSDCSLQCFHLFHSGFPFLTPIKNEKDWNDKNVTNCTFSRDFLLPNLCNMRSEQLCFMLRVQLRLRLPTWNLRQIRQACDNSFIDRIWSRMCDRLGGDVEFSFS